MSTSNIETLRDQFELAYATEWHTNGGRNKSTIAELAEVIKTWRNGNTYDDDLPSLQFGWEGFQWHAAATARRVQLAAERKGRIYVAGPMTGYPDLNFPAFHTAAAQLREQGWHVENPADHGEVPGAEWADYMHVDVAMLASCGAIYLLPGWSKSRGGSVEAMLAHWLGMEFHFAEGAERLEHLVPLGFEAQWLVCCHPAWADPLICRSAADAVRVVRDPCATPHEAFIVRKLHGGRMEFRGEEIDALKGDRDGQ